MTIADYIAVFGILIPLIVGLAIIVVNGRTKTLIDISLLQQKVISLENDKLEFKDIVTQIFEELKEIRSQINKHENKKYN
jgi:hypothetical protein